MEPVFKATMVAKTQQPTINDYLISTEPSIKYFISCILNYLNNFIFITIHIIIRIVLINLVFTFDIHCVVVKSVFILILDYEHFK